MLLLIDNYDSFSHNLARYFVELGQTVKVVRNNEIEIADIASLAPDYLVVSPGPCTPNEAGISLAAIEHFKDKLPILGVCLGHQAIGQVFGAKVVRAKKLMHGKTSEATHDRSSQFAKVATQFQVTRYHSLLLDQASLPSSFKVSAWCDDNEGGREIMAMRHTDLPIYGVQFHPESLLTPDGKQILMNFLALNE